MRIRVSYEVFDDKIFGQKSFASVLLMLSKIIFSELVFSPDPVLLDSRSEDYFVAPDNFVGFKVGS